MRRLQRALARVRFEQWVLLLVVIVSSVSTSVFAVSTSRQADHNRQRIQENRRLTQENRRLARDGVLAKKVLCALRVQTVHHVARSRRELARARTFLREHPNGFAGISASVIEASIREDERGVRDDQDALVVLAILNCEKGTP